MSRSEKMIPPVSSESRNRQPTPLMQIAGSPGYPDPGVRGRPARSRSGIDFGDLGALDTDAGNQTLLAEDEGRHIVIHRRQHVQVGVESLMG